MSRKTEILSAFVDRLVDDSVALRANIIRHFVVLDQVNDFPAISFVSPREQRLHYGDNRRIAQLEILLRGYTYNGDDPIGEAELLARSIEQSVDTFAITGRNLGVYEARVTSLRTDDGHFEPAGVVDIELEITYEVER